MSGPRSVIDRLFISFTLDPMLSAYWGDPPGHAQRPRGWLGARLTVFNTWFDAQADRYSRVIAWALHHRAWMALIAVLTLAGALALQKYTGRTDFLPKTDGEMIAVQVNTPSSASLEYNRRKVEKAAELARTIRETKATNSNVGGAGGRVYVDLG